jgi:hypothetical protein
MYIVRGLAAAFSRGFLSPEIREFVQGYLGVQVSPAVLILSSMTLMELLYLVQRSY